MNKYLIKDTTVHERIEIIKQWEETEGCENSGFDLMDFYNDYINGKKEISEINAAYSARYVSEIPEQESRQGCGMGTKH